MKLMYLSQVMLIGACLTQSAAIWNMKNFVDQNKIVGVYTITDDPSVRFKMEVTKWDRGACIRAENGVNVTIKNMTMNCKNTFMEFYFENEGS